jgi:hypothetical protein
MNFEDTILPEQTKIKLKEKFFLFILEDIKNNHPIQVLFFKNSRVGGRNSGYVSSGSSRQILLENKD